MELNRMTDYESTYSTDTVQQQAEMAAQRTKQSQTVQAAESAASSDTSSTSTSDSEYQAILAKVNSGQALSSNELSALKAKNPGKYAQALRAQNARSELRTQMEQDPGKAAKTARQAIASADEEDARALDDEYRRFASKYDQVDFDN